MNTGASLQIDEKWITPIVSAELQAGIMRAMGPEIYEKLIVGIVKQVLTMKVDNDGKPGRGYSREVPWLEYMVGSELRLVVRKAVQEMIAERTDEIKDQSQKLALEEINQMAQQWTQGIDPIRFLADFATCEQLWHRIMAKRDQTVCVVFQDLNLGLEGALGHREDDTLDLILQIWRRLPFIPWRNIKADMIAADLRPDDALVHVGQLGLNLAS